MNREDAKRVGRIVVKFIADVVSSALDSSPTYRTSGYSRVINTVKHYPRNDVESAISVIGDSAKNATWDSNRVEAAKRIKNILDKNDASSETKTYAINVLSDIMDDICWSSSRDQVIRIIEQIATK